MNRRYFLHKVGAGLATTRIASTFFATEKSANADPNRNSLQLVGGNGKELSATLEIGSRRELFVDRYLIAGLRNVQLRLQTPVYKEVSFELNNPWEGRDSAYFTVLRDTDRFRLYYRGMPGEPPVAPDVRFTCYAESPDGIHWTKPHLGLFELYGTRLAGSPARLRFVMKDADLFPIRFRA